MYIRLFLPNDEELFFSKNSDFYMLFKTAGQEQPFIINTTAAVTSFILQHRQYREKESIKNCRKRLGGGKVVQRGHYTWRWGSRMLISVFNDFLRTCQ